MTVAEFIAKWSASGAAERANKDSFLIELCDLLGVPRPQSQLRLAVVDALFQTEPEGGFQLREPWHINPRLNPPVSE